jgi:hypothetical protein
MQNLSFSDGFKEFSLNGDESKVIRFNPADFGIIERIDKAYKEIENASKIGADIKLKTDGTPIEEISIAASIVKSVSDTIKSQIDHIFDSPVSAVVFGNQSPLSMVGGVPFYERFLNAVIPVLKKEIQSEQKASQQRISKYTKVIK